MDDVISVVIPSYNSAPYIESCIECVLNQKYKKTDVVVIDDCSTDDTEKIVLQYRDRITYVRNEKNQGAARTRNIGVELSRGGMVAFLDSDDKWTPNKLELFAEAFANNESIDYGFSDFSRFSWSTGAFFSLSNSQIFPQIYKTIEFQKYTKHKCFVIPREEMFPLLLGGYPIYPSTIVVRKRIFSSAGMWRKVKTNEDFDFSLRSRRVTDFLYIDESLAWIGRHPTNISVDFLRQQEGDLDVFELHLDDPSYRREEIDLIRNYRAKRLCGLAHSHLLLGDRKTALRRYGQALSNRKWFWHALARIAYISVGGGLTKRASPG